MTPIVPICIPICCALPNQVEGKFWTYKPDDETWVIETAIQRACTQIKIIQRLKTL